MRFNFHSLRRAGFFAAATFFAFVNVNAQQSRPAAPVITETSPGSDTIGERAAWNLEQQRLKNAPPPTSLPSPIGFIPAPTPNTQRAGSAPEFALTGIRGFADALEGSFLINGKRAAGSTRYPTLVDGWRVFDISAAGAVIERNRERKQLPFSGSSPYQEKAAQATTGAPAIPLASPVSGFGGQSPVINPFAGFPIPANSNGSVTTPAGVVPAIR